MTPKKDDIAQLCDAINADLESEKTRQFYANLEGEGHAPADKKEALEKWLDEGNNLELPVWVSKKNES
jgi:pyruvate-formate lyase-activating enzyme